MATRPVSGITVTVMGSWSALSWLRRLATALSCSRTMCRSARRQARRARRVGHAIG